MIRLVLADDQELMREGLAMLLNAQADLEVVGQAADGEQAVRVVAELEPDVVLMDVRMPRVDGLQATRQIVASGSPTRVLVLTTFDVDDYVYAALAAGASGFLLKDAPRASILQGIRSVCTGDVLIAASATRRLVEQVGARRGSPPSPLLRTLTTPELDVLRAVARGSSNAEIAAELFVSEATVKTHVARLLSKLQQRDRVQLVVFAYENGVTVSPWTPDSRHADTRLVSGAEGAHRPGQRQHPDPTDELRASQRRARLDSHVVHTLKDSLHRDPAVLIVVLGLARTGDGCEPAPGAQSSSHVSTSDRP